MFSLFELVFSLPTDFTVSKIISLCFFFFVANEQERNVRDNFSISSSFSSRRSCRIERIPLVLFLHQLLKVRDTKGKINGEDATVNRRYSISVSVQYFSTLYILPIHISSLYYSISIPVNMYLYRHCSDCTDIYLYLLGAKTKGGPPFRPVHTSSDDRLRNKAGFSISLSLTYNRQLNLAKQMATQQVTRMRYRKMLTCSFYLKENCTSL